MKTFAVLAGTAAIRPETIPRLAAALSSEIVARVTMVGSPEGMGQIHGRDVLAIAELDDAELPSVQAALAMVGLSDAELFSGPFDDVGVPQSGPPQVFTEDELKGENHGLSKEIDRIINGPATGVKFPEQAYSGEKAHVHKQILSRLKLKRPLYKSAGQDLSEAEILNLDLSGLPDCAKEIKDDLLEEKIAFGLVAETFGDTGHWRAFLRDITFEDGPFLDIIYEKYLKLDFDNVLFSLDFLVKQASSAMSSLGGKCGDLAAGLFSALWLQARTKLSAEDRLRGNIDELKRKFAVNFEILVHANELIQGTLNSDWGKLEALRALQHDGKMDWPTDMSQARLWAVIAYHRTTILTLFPEYDRNKLLKCAVRGKKGQKARFDPKHGIYTYTTHAKDMGGCKGYWCYAYMIGKAVTVGGHLLADPIPPELSWKLFGVTGGDITDPPLHMPKELYLSNLWHLDEAYIPPVT